MADIENILKKYIELRDRKAELVKKQGEELAPFSEAMDTIENYLMHTMNTLGCDQLKAADVGTAFKAHATSCQMQDPVAFKNFVFAPVAEGIANYLRAAGYGLRPEDEQSITTLLREMPKWDMVEFRSGKKGIQEFIANEQQPVPGIAVNTVATVNIRRA